MSRLKYLFILFSIFLSTIHWTSAKNYANYSGIEFKVYIDQDFDFYDKDRISSALADWNYTFNGAAEFVIADWNFNYRKPKIVHKRDIIIFKISKENKEFQKQFGKIISNIVMAFTDHIGGNIIYVVNEHIKGNELIPILRHEIGHLMGVSHGAGLMQPYFNRTKSNCIDDITVYRVCKHLNLRMDEMIYCNHYNERYTNINL